MLNPLPNHTYYLFTFANTHRAIEAQRYLKGQDFLTLPTPTLIHRSCGIAILCLEENYSTFQTVLAAKMNENLDFFTYHLQFLGNGRWQLM